MLTLTIEKKEKSAEDFAIFLQDVATRISGGFTVGDGWEIVGGDNGDETTD